MAWIALALLVVLNISSAEHPRGQEGGLQAKQEVADAEVEQMLRPSPQPDGSGYWTGLFVILLMIGACGAAGGYLSGGGRAVEGRPPRLGKAGPYIAGIAGGIVAITFVSGPVEYHYEVLFTLVNGGVPNDAMAFTKLVKGVVTILAVATIGGYLGVGLLETTANSLWKKEVEGRVESLGQHVDSDRLLRESRALLAGGETNLAWERLEPMPKTSTMRDFDRMNLHLLRGFALKRRGMVDAAMQEADAALSIRGSYSGWYNKACYTALLYGQHVTDAQALEVEDLIQRALQAARAAGGDGAALKSMRQWVQADVGKDGDLFALRDRQAIKELVDEVAAE
ncbi:MAG: hypothetical protein F4Y01_10730 [Gammaproteobacteria bacterium]|nr:hypothetical protein [Gammaproteobacteria bacterium]